MLFIRLNNIYFTITNFIWPRIQLHNILCACCFCGWMCVRVRVCVCVCWFGGGWRWRQRHLLTYNVLALLVSSSHRTKLIVTADLVPSGFIWFTNTLCGLAVSDFMQKRASALARLAVYSLSQMSHEIIFPKRFSRDELSDTLPPNIWFKECRLSVPACF